MARRSDSTPGPRRVCPECKAAGRKDPTFLATYLPTHRRRSHGVSTLDQDTAREAKRARDRAYYHERQRKQQQEQSQLVVSRADTTTLTLTPAEGIVLFTDGNGGIYVVEKLR